MSGPWGSGTPLRTETPGNFLLVAGLEAGRRGQVEAAEEVTLKISSNSVMNAESNQNEIAGVSSSERFKFIYPLQEPKGKKAIINLGN